jgi:hypothetical protein
MSPYIPYLMTVRQGPANAVDSGAMADGLGRLAFRMAAIHQAVASWAKLAGPLARGRRGDAARTSAFAAAPAVPGRLCPDRSMERV